MRASLLAVLVIPACTGHLPDAPPEEAVRPEVLFAGVGCGRGVLTFRNGALDDAFTVTSRGRESEDGFVLDQTVRFGSGKVTERRWTMRPSGERTYEGTLTEASGPVKAVVAGGTLRLTYPMEDVPGGRMTQHLHLLDDGNVMNVATVTAFGIPVRRLSERIEPHVALEPDAEAACDSFEDEGGPT
ncbi:DUF3833 family protein [Parvularcula dongshanensis]|uniref:DUF3833 family protein n=1 Tax=Parvularcula dongshanensis TaxID=1173995 RepID=A0A840I6K8_9PROT|nr:DUF3833 family protein [Parvularcula dongshanensis]MBB4659814.1 hypothetical protein [Parvularcula dongshanensis]